MQAVTILTVFFQAPYLVYRPSLEMGVADGFYDMIDGLIGDIFRQSSKIGRLAKQCNQEHYQVNLQYILSGCFVDRQK